MNILSLNTSFNESYVAVKTNSQTILKQMDSSLKQSENILGLIDMALYEAKIKLANVDAIACVVGPGSFTGIRIGAGLAKGFCSAMPNIKRIPINSLDLLAYSFSKTMPKNNFWVCLNALSGNYFVCKYSAAAKQLCEPFLAFGDDVEKIDGCVVGIKQECLEICNSFVELSAKDLLEYAEILNENILMSEDFTPVYLRKSQAEAELDKKNGNS